MPMLGKASATNLRLLNPRFEYVLFDDRAMSDFVAEHFPQYGDAFASLSKPIYRYDIFRYMAAYRLGGFYFDSDVFLVQGLDELTQCRSVFPFERLTWTDYLRDRLGQDWEIGNYAFGAEPGHPFLEKVLKNCFRALDDTQWREIPLRSLPGLLRQDLEVIYTTGPGMVTRTLAESNGFWEGVTVLFPADVTDKGSWNRFGEFGVHLGSGGWRPGVPGWKRRIVNILGRLNEKRAIKKACQIGTSRTFGAA
jgi:hypothetical protein